MNTDPEIFFFSTLSELPFPHPLLEQASHTIQHAPSLRGFGRWRQAYPFSGQSNSENIIVIIIILIALCQLRHLSQRNSKTMGEAVPRNKRIMATINWCYFKKIYIIKLDSYCVTWRISTLCSNNLSCVFARKKKIHKSWQGFIS